MACVCLCALCSVSIGHWAMPSISYGSRWRQRMVRITRLLCSWMRDAGTNGISRNGKYPPIDANGNDINWIDLFNFPHQNTERERRKKPKTNQMNAVIQKDLILLFECTTQRFVYDLRALGGMCDQILTISALSWRLRTAPLLPHLTVHLTKLALCGGPKQYKWACGILWPEASSIPTAHNGNKTSCCVSTPLWISIPFFFSLLSFLYSAETKKKKNIFFSFRNSHVNVNRLRYVKWNVVHIEDKIVCIHYLLLSASTLYFFCKHRHTQAHTSDKSRYENLIFHLTWIF